MKFVVVGDGRYLNDFNREIEERRQPAEKIPELLAASDAAFLSFQNAELWKMTIPAKLQSYMACGMPILASAEGETERVIKEAECGLCSKIGDAEELARLGINSRKYFEEHFDKGMLMDQMEGYF